MRDDQKWRELTDRELVVFHKDRQTRIARGETVIDLTKFHPCVTTSGDGQGWLVYRRVGTVLGA